MILWRLGTRGLGVISTLILAHVLVPQDFGVVAIATTYVTAFDAISAFGLQDAIIRIGGSGEKLHDTAFTLSIVRGALNAAIVVLTAPLAASFFNEPRIAAVLYMLAIVVLLEGFENIGIVDFRRDMRFDKDFQLFMLPRLVSVTVTICCSLIFRSYWALICGILALRLVRLAATYVLHPYRPRLSVAEWRQLSGFSFWTWATSIAGFTRDRSWTIVIGRFFDPASVGSFTMASEIGLLPTSELIYPICRALFSGFALARHEGTNLAPAFARTLGVLAIPVLPAAIGISAVGNYVVAFALGSQWGNSISIMQIIAACSPFTLLTAIGGTVMDASGNIRNNFWIVAVSAVIGVSASAIMASYYGMNGIAIATGTLMTLEGLVFLVVTMRSVRASLGDIFYRLWRPIIATLAMSAALWGSGYGWQLSIGPAVENVRNCAIAISIGAISYTAVMLVLWKLSGDKDPLEVFVLNTVRKSIART
ncbi:MAG TPA: oligosaccharide flippase family protein [Aliidongia sp.]|uniref:oligosaccharide flippase family protein n=1 Tax=Aliidongia sp. TaxID=1914230 RepID=UPI002DDD2CA7|nr:oligosaccharide flippase family protein [Aliidongia sp.]HEV2677309.1 oligosaccharide flippase family protein [Aliidongia sp.]